MDAQAAQLIQETWEAVEGTDELTIKTGYSGRGMYGHQTAAIECNDISQFIQAIGYVMTESDDEGIMIVAEALTGGIKNDNLGLNMVFY